MNILLRPAITLFILLNFVGTEAAQEAAAPHFLLDIGAHKLQGLRSHDEDRTLVHQQRLFGVFDGHGGDQVVNYAAAHFADHFDHAVGDDEKKLEAALGEIEKYAESSFQDGSILRSGTTAAVAALRGKELTIAHVGDSRAMLLRKDRKAKAQPYEIQFCTQDHAPIKDSPELKRIQKHGAFAKKGYVLTQFSVMQALKDRVRFDDDSIPMGAVLAPTRALGDIAIKKNRLGPNGYDIILSTPDIQKIDVEEDDILLLATDGYWTVRDLAMSGQYSEKLPLEFFNRDLTNPKITAQQKAKRMIRGIQTIERALDQQQDTTDNITAVVVQFRPGHEPALV